MKIELIKQTTKWTGDVYYFVEIDGVFQSNSFTSDIEKAKASFQKSEELVQKYPETVKESIYTIEL